MNGEEINHFHSSSVDSCAVIAAPSQEHCPQLGQFIRSAAIAPRRQARCCALVPWHERTIYMGSMPVFLCIGSIYILSGALASWWLRRNDVPVPVKRKVLAATLVWGGILF